MANIYKAGTPQASRALAGASIAFGVFDGVHRGHQAVLARAANGTGRSAALTFDADPDELFNPGSLRKLMTNSARIDALAASGVDTVVVLPFSDRFANLEPDEFLERAFGDNPPSRIVVGTDFRFGRGAAGTVDTLARWGERANCVVEPFELLRIDGKPVTSSRIRALLAKGEVEAATELLGHRYVLEGTVVAGRHEGGNMGFRTANLELPAQLQAIGEGVYAAYATVAGKRAKAAVSVGVAPTFAEQSTATCEAHLLDFNEEVYGQRLSLEFVTWLRPMIKFDSVDELISTVMGNIAWVRDNL